MSHSNEEATDVVVVGGGPAGSAAAIRLAQAGLQVIQLERRVFHDSRNDALRSGEGILACTGRELTALGVEPCSGRWALDPVDRIALHWPHGSTNTLRLRPASIVHVDREQLDADLFDHARAAGVDAREGWRASDFLYDENGVSGVVAHGPDQEVPHQIRARVVIDGGGRSALSIRRFKLRTALPGDDFFAMALFFDDVEQMAERTWEMHFFDPARLTVVQLSRVKPGLVRCGLGTTRAAFQATKFDPQAFFWQRLGAMPQLRKRFAHSHEVRPPFARVMFGYHVCPVAMDGLLLVGDAAGYVNPIFGDGMLRALRDGRAAAATVLAALDRGVASQHALAPYARRHAMLAARDQILARLISVGYSLPKWLSAANQLRRASEQLLRVWR